VRPPVAQMIAMRRDRVSAHGLQQLLHEAALVHRDRQRRLGQPRLLPFLAAADVDQNDLHPWRRLRAPPARSSAPAFRRRVQTRKAQEPRQARQQTAAMTGGEGFHGQTDLTTAPELQINNSGKGFGTFIAATHNCRHCQLTWQLCRVASVEYQYPQRRSPCTFFNGPRRQLPAYPATARPPQDGWRGVHFLHQCPPAPAVDACAPALVQAHACWRHRTGAGSRLAIGAETVAGNERHVGLHQQPVCQLFRRDAGAAHVRKRIERPARDPATDARHGVELRHHQVTPAREGLRASLRSRPSGQ
jgi:hypothetical protein